VDKMDENSATGVEMFGIAMLSGITGHDDPD
jgi:hypothetical protein